MLFQATNCSTRNAPMVPGFSVKGTVGCHPYSRKSQSRSSCVWGTFFSMWRCKTLLQCSIYSRPDFPLAEGKLIFVIWIVSLKSVSVSNKMSASTQYDWVGGILDVHYRELLSMNSGVKYRVFNSRALSLGDVLNSGRSQLVGRLGRIRRSPNSPYSKTSGF